MGREKTEKKNEIMLLDESLISDKIYTVRGQRVMLDVDYYSDLAAYMKEFGEPHIRDGYLVYNGQPFRSDLIFAQIYEYAKRSIILIDNYINLKSLQLLIYSYKGVKITVYTDNLSKELTKAIFDDFQKEYPDMDIKLYQTGELVPY